MDSESNTTEDPRLGFERWLTVTQDLSEHSIRAYCADADALHRFLGDTFCISMLTTDHVYALIGELSDAGLAPSSIRRRLSGVRRYCRWLVQNGYLVDDPTHALFVRISRSRQLPRAVSEIELRRLLAHLGQRVQDEGRSDAARRNVLTTLVGTALMLGTGVRVAELVAIASHDIDLPGGRIRVLGKGRRERLVYLTNERLVELVRLYEQHTSCIREGPELLVNRHGRRLSTAAMRTRLARAANDAGIAAPLTPHMLRHSAATQLIEHGVDIRFVQRLLGHASLTTTELYTHVADVSLRRAVSDADVIGALMTSR